MGSVVAKCSTWLCFWYNKVLPFWPDFGTKSCHFFAFNFGSKFTYLHTSDNNFDQKYTFSCANFCAFCQKYAFSCQKHVYTHFLCAHNLCKVCIFVSHLMRPTTTCVNITCFANTIGTILAQFSSFHMGAKVP